MYRVLYEKKYKPNLIAVGESAKYRQNCQLRLAEMEQLYRPDLSITAFHIYSINGPFLLQILLFVVSHVVFLTHTN